MLVRRVEEDDVPRLKISNQALMKKVACFIVDNFGLIFGNPAKVKVRLDKTTHFARAIDKRNMRRSPR
jgi:hypothetical protein